MPQAAPQYEIEFIAVVARIQTLADGGVRLTLDLGEGNALAMAKLMEVKEAGLYGKVSFSPTVTDH